ncbi:magnesium transporter MgtE N-terminal domain-containing protein [Photobacterium lipolyticum]|uniref:Magnesium transporter MgtE intracellular domain-containing protein n=1 Tax=Photobacterium lipolyticum TaxID=266810 RepID=A0A2T3MPY8_9GAMM|nr:hypothetical protein [Photobacterium lipolyticum]PSV98968.1 hypothetical protein C9I89_21955 [Photobacterium lipolyticum]
MSLEVEFPRISNLPKEQLREVWLNLSDEDFNKLIIASNGKEIVRVFSVLDEVSLRKFFSIAEPITIEKVFSSIPSRNINKYLFMLSNENIRRIFSALSPETQAKVLKSVSETQRNRLLKLLPHNMRLKWKEYIQEELDLDSEYNHIFSSQIENSIEYEALQRLKQIEQKIAYKEQHHEIRVEQQAKQLEALQQQTVDSEKRLHQQHVLSERKAQELKRREAEISGRLAALQAEHDQKIQERIELKVPEYVSDAIDGLNDKEQEFKTKADEWNTRGANSLKWAIGAAVAALAYGAYSFNVASQSNIDWLFFTYLILKGLVIIGLLGAFAKHCFNQGNAYMHEALKRSDRVHAIRFGKLYLEIYGNNVEKEDMKSIFENWNIESDSAFTKVPSPNFEPKTLEQMKGIFEKSVPINSATKTS